MLRSRRVVPCCAVLLLTACTTPSGPSAVAPAADADVVESRSEAASTPAAAAAVEDDPMVCERVIPTGSRVAQRICQRRSVIEANQRDSQEFLGEVQKRGVLVNDSKQ